MAQLMSVRLSRSDAAPWGFRLQGGKDFGSPLLIQKVNGGSPAEKAGLQAGDAVIKVNNTEVFNLRHKDAQDNIVRAGNSFEITVQRGGSTWKPAITPVGPQPVKPQSAGHITPVTKTSLAANKPAASPIGSGHNYSPAPFGQQQMNGNGMDPVKSIVNKQYNSPVGIYSEETIAETLSAQAEVLAGGVLGVNFKKNERNYDPANSEVLKMLNEYANEPKTSEPEVTMPCFERPAPVPMATALPFSVAGLRHVTAPEPRPALADDQKTVLPPGQNICGECERLVVGVFVRIKDKNLHVECFKCATCGTSLKNVGYYNINNKLYCDVHAKLVARQHPPAPNLEPITVPPGGQKPAGAISAALANRGPMSAPAPAPASPQPSNFAPMPFHAPRSGPTHVQSPRPVQAPGGFSGIKPSFNAAPPMPSVQKLPSMPSAPVPAPFTTPAKPAPAGSKFVWPPKNPPEELSTSSTATPLYIPPGPTNQSASLVSQFDQSAAVVSSNRKSSLRSQSVQSVPQVQPFPQPYADFMTHQPVARPMSAYQYNPKPLGTNEARPRSAFAEPTKLPKANVTFEQDVQYRESEMSTLTNLEENSSNAYRKKFSMCSQEVMDFTVRNVMSSSIEQLSETIDTAILVSALTGRESPVPMEHVPFENVQETAPQNQETITETQNQSSIATSEQSGRDNKTHRDEKELVVALKHVIETQGESIEEIHQQTEQIADLFLKHSEAVPEQKPPSSDAHLQTVKPQPWQSQLVSALTTAPDRPYSPLPTPVAPTETNTAPKKTLSPRPTTLPVSYRQLPQLSGGFVPIAHEEPNPLPILIDQPQHSTFISALTIAPDRPYSPLPQPAAPLPMKPVPYPVQTAPYQPPRSEACVSPMISALTVAPQRPYSPFSVTKAPTSILDSIQDMKANIDVGEPFNLPTPSQYSTMISALTIAPERPYTPLCVTQAPTMTTDAKPVETKVETAFKIVPPKIVGDLQAAVYKPTAVMGIPQVPQSQDVVETEPPKSFPPVSEELKKDVQATTTKTSVVQKTESTAAPAKAIETTPNQKSQKAPEKEPRKQKTVKIEEPAAAQPKNALNLYRPTQQRPITPNIPRPITPSMITGLQKPAAIPYYQQNIGDGDFPCRSPRPATPSLICPMTVPRPATPGVQAGGRPVTPIPHKQLNVVRSLTPITKSPATQSQNIVAASESSQQQKVSQHSDSNISSQQTPQVVVTRKTHVTEEFESFHKESTKIIEKSGTTQKCLSQTEQTSAIAEQSEMFNREIMAITNGDVTRRGSSTLQSSQIAAQSQQITYEKQHSTQTASQNQPIATQQLPNTSQMQLLPTDGFISLEESQRASPLPFPNISLPDGMTYEVVDNKALYTAGQNKQVFKLNQHDEPKDPASQFKVQAPTHKQPFIQLMAPKFEPKVPCPSVPSAFAQPPVQFTPVSIPTQNITESQQPIRQTKFQPLAPQPVPASSQPIQAPTATLPVNVILSQQYANSFQPAASQGINTFTPKSSGNGFQNFNPKVVASEPAPCPVSKVTQESTSRRASGFQGVGSINVAPQNSTAPLPNVSQGFTPRRPSQGSASRGIPDVTPNNVVPAIRAPGLMDPCTSPPNAGGGSGPKAASFAGSSAPVRGRGVLNQAQPGGRQAMCGQCHLQIRGPFVTALGKIWCPEHFVCVNAQCKRQLADIGFVEEKGQLYCEYCFEQFIAPACSKCSAKIKGDCLNAIGKHFHPECFVCCYCNKLFGNNPFFLEDGMPYCQADWNELFTTKCFACGFPIEAGDRWVEALNNNYHSQCFNCTSCKKNLEGQSFFAKSGRPFCKAHAR